MATIMSSAVLFLCCFGLFFVLTDGQCTLPLSDGTWHSSTRGTWTVATSGGATEVSNFEAALSYSSNVATLTCQQSSGTQYILGTNFEIFFQVFINVSVCLDIRTISDENTDSYIFYFATAVDDATGERFTSNTDGACSEIGYETVANVQILVKDGFVASAAMQLPNLALGNYSVTYEVLLSAVTVENCTLDTCTNKTLMEFGNSDPTQYLGFTSGGQMYSIYTDSSGTDTFTLTYNADVSPDGINTHRFACWALLYSDGTLQATVLPEQCEGSQTSTAVTSGGQRLTMTPYFTCGPEEEAVGGLAGWVIALIVLGILALILIVAIIIVFICMRKTVASLDDEEMLKKEGSRQSTPDSLAGYGEKEREAIKNIRHGKDPAYKPFKREKPDREGTFDLTEIGKPGGGKKLQDGQPVEAEKRVETSKSVQLRKDIQGGESLGPIVFPPGKKPIPPTTPRPDKDDEVLLRIKKERERKEREREERRKKEKQAEELRIKMEVKKDPEEMVDKVIKHPKEPESSDEYETDDSEKEERAKQLMEKRRRLAGATWTPPGGLSNAKDVVGRKKRRKRHGHDEGELGGALVTREQQYQLEFDRRRQKKAMRKRAKGRRQQSDVSGSETDTDNGQRRRKRRKPLARGAPFMDKYIVKKEIEHELDEIDFWNEKTNTAKNVDDIIDEKPKGSGELPDGFHFDKEGNVVRNVDGKLIPKDIYLKQMELRKRFNVFALPRLKRSTDGRPVGGYKDDEFGPTASWDFGEPASGTDGEEDKRQSVSIRPASGRQVAFSVGGDRSKTSSPLEDIDYNTRKGRQLGSAERGLLKQRLFDKNGKPTTEEKHPTTPIFFKGPTGGLKADAVYIDSAQIERHEPVKAPARSQSQRPPASGSQMIKRSDTFEDGRPNMSRRKSRLRSSWTGNANLIPEEDNAMQGMSKGKRNIGSDDEFFLVVGSINQLSKPPEILDSQLGINRCTRYSERHGAPREPSGLTDISMRTAPDSTTPDKVNCRKYLEELYKDKIYFDKYIKTEKLPTNAAVETRELADHARSSLNNLAVYLKEHQPLNPAPPPSELRLKLSRMHTVHAEDSRKNSMPISVSERPLSADDIRDSTVASKAQSREVTMSLTTDRSAWAPVDTTGELVPPSPVGISGERVAPVGGPSGSIEKTVTIDEPSKNLTREKSSTKPPAPQKHSPAKKTSVATQEAVIPNNVMSLVDTS
ncbi:uncharacterized protein LOC128227542 isoform X2 [Mya arenaria]|uniref:uncharacterized protein LOC128227542 isoform X2 n=1 Tax=Mya arenaria TaxID=6604 RepID=UPI0022E50F1F|nr:uncharacterized protein LOC128227542 isoform X2 [Mya arenaria]